MTVKDLTLRLLDVNMSAEVGIHAYFTESELLIMLDRCEECGAGPDSKVTLYIAPVREVTFPGDGGTGHVFLSV